MRIQSFLIATALWAAPAFAQAPVAPAPITVAPVAPAPLDTPSALTSNGTLVGVRRLPGVSAPVHPETKQPLLPPAGSGPVVYTIVLCFPKQGNVSLVDPPDLPVLHAAVGRSRQPAVAEHLEAVQRGGRADSSSATTSGSGRRTSSTI